MDRWLTDALDALTVPARREQVEDEEREENKAAPETDSRAARRGGGPMSTSTGIRKLHSKGCAGRDGGRCNCGAGWEASVYSKRDDKKIRKTFANMAEAKTWRDDANTQLAKGGLRAPTPTTILEAWEEWIEGAKAGTIRNRSGDPFKPSALRAYEGAMRREVLPEFGPVRLSELRRGDLQEFADRLLARGLSPSAVQGALLPRAPSIAGRSPATRWRPTPARGCISPPSGADASVTPPPRRRRP
jgi:Phage integrase, N-terminal SAM-like domain